MPDDTAKKLLWDAPKAAQKIVRFAEGRDFKACCEDEMLSAAIARQFEIIGEAFTVSRRKDPDTAARRRLSQYPDPRLRGHGQRPCLARRANDLPPLIEQLNALLAE